MPALLHALEEATAPGSAAVLGRINPMTGRVPVSITQTRRPIFDRVGAAKNRRASPGTRTFTGCRRARMPALVPYLRCASWRVRRILALEATLFHTGPKNDRIDRECPNTVF